MATLYTHIKTVLYSIIFVVVVLNVFFLLSTPTAHSGATDNLTGYAWSDTIGWISFNSTNEASTTADYGVTVALNGDMSGYAWSEHIGWISFNESDGSHIAPRFDKVSGAVTGWARALSPASGVNTGGWDGWISLSGTATDGSSYGVVATGADWEDFAWGSDVVGWISFGGMTADGNPYGVIGTDDYSKQAPAPSITQFEVCDAGGMSGCVASSSPDPKIVAPNTPLSVKWGSSNSDTCTGDGNASFSTGGAVSGEDNTVNATSLQNETETFRLICARGTDILNAPVETIDVVTTQVILSATPRTVNAGSDATLSWDTGVVVDEATCTIRGGIYPTATNAPFVADDVIGDDIHKGSINVTINARTTYTMTCGALTDTETIDIVPRGTET
ncbi:MAG: hypothetical protein NUW00_03640 [Candidatus Kaiserbacteria bacterium]|nr:hypothetical protein [Candidatus Kaiserbacteria bacterium]